MEEENKALQAKVNPLTAGLGLGGLKGQNLSNGTKELSKESKVFEVTKNDGTTENKSYNELTPEEKKAVDDGTGVVAGGKTDVGRKYIAVSGNVGTKPVKNTSDSSALADITGIIAATALGARTGGLAGAVIGGGTAMVFTGAKNAEESVKYRDALKDFNKKVSENSTLAGTWEDDGEGNQIFIPDYSKVGDNVNVDESGAKINELLSLDPAEPEVYFDDKGVLHVDINRSFAGTKRYRDIIGAISDAYPGLSKDDSYAEDAIKNIKEYLSGALSQYVFEMNRVAAYKEKLPNADVDTILDAAKNEIGAQIDDEDKKDWLVRVYRDGKIVDSNAEEVLDNVYNMKDKYERDDYLEGLADLLNDDSVSDNDKAYILSEYNLLFSASDADVKDGDENGGSRKKYSEMLNQDFLVTVLKSSSIINGADSLFDGLASIFSDGEVDDILIADQNYLEPDEKAANIGAVAGAAFDTYVTWKTMKFLESKTVRPVLGQVSKALGKKLISTGVEGMEKVGKKLVDASWTPVVSKTGEILGYRTALDLSGIKTSALNNVIQAFSGVDSISYRLIGKGSAQIMAWSLGELAINFTSDAIFDAAKLGTAMLDGEIKSDEEAAKYMQDSLGQDLVMDIIFQYGPQGMLDIRSTSDAIRLQHIEPFAQEVASARAKYGELSSKVEELKGKRTKGAKATRDEFIKAQNALTKAEAEYNSARKKWGASKSERLGAKLADIEAKATEKELIRKFQEVVFDENAAGTALARSAYAVSGGDVSLYSKLLNSVSNNLPTLTRIAYNELASDKWAKGTGAAIDKFKQTYSDISSYRGKISDADINYIKAKNELIRYEEAAKGDKDRIKAARKFYKEYISGVEKTRAAQLDQLMDTMRNVVNKTNESAINAGIQTEENIQTKRSATGFQSQGYIPMYLKRKNNRGSFTMGQERNLDHTWDRGEFWDLDSLENPVLNTLTYVNYTAHNIAVNERNKTIIAATEIPGMRTYRTDIDNKVIRTHDGNHYKHSDVMSNARNTVVKSSAKKLKAVKKTAPSGVEYTEAQDKIAFGKSGDSKSLRRSLSSAASKAWKTVSDKIDAIDRGIKEAERKIETAEYSTEQVHTPITEMVRADIINKTGVDIDELPFNIMDDENANIVRMLDDTKGATREGSLRDYNRGWKRKDVRVVLMSPSEYNKVLVRDARSNTDTETADNIYWDSNTSKYVAGMNSGDKFPIPYIKYDDNGFSGQEGRHRASAAERAGIEKIPVAVEIPVGSGLRKFGFRNYDDITEEVSRIVTESNASKKAAAENAKNELEVRRAKMVEQSEQVKKLAAGEALRNNVTSRLNKLIDNFNSTYGEYGFKTSPLDANDLKRIADISAEGNIDKIVDFVTEFKDSERVARPTNKMVSDAVFEKMTDELNAGVNKFLDAHYPGLSENQKAGLSAEILDSVRVGAIETGDELAAQIAKATKAKASGYPITYFEGGEEKTAYIKGPLAKSVYDMTVRSTNVTDRNFIQRVFQDASKLKRYKTTAINVTRAVPNLLRDVLRGDVFSGGVDYAGAKKYFAEILDAEGLTVEQKNKAMASIELATRVAQGQTLNAAVENRTERGLQDMVRETRQEGKNVVSRIIWDVSHGRIGHALETPMNVAEISTRRRMAQSAFTLEFKNAKYTSASFEERLDKAYQAGVNSGIENTTNFSRKGAAVGAIARYVPYFQQNFANIESANNAFLKDPMGVACRAAIFQYAFMMVLADTLKKEETRKAYYNLSDYDRKNNIVFSLDGKTLVTIPLDQSLSSLITPWRRTMETLNNVDPETFAGIFTETLLDLSPLDLGGFTEGDSLNIRRGLERIAAQAGASLATDLLQTITGYNLYYGTSYAVTDETLKQYGRTAKSAGDYTTSSANSKILRGIADATGIPQWRLQQTVSNFGNDVGQYVLNALDKLAGASKDEQGGKDFVDAVFKSMIGSDSNESKNQFYNGINTLKKDKEKLISELNNLSDEISTASGDKLAELKKKYQEKKDDYAKKVSNFVTQYLNAFEITGGLSKSQANQIYYLFNLYDDDTAYEVGSVGEYYQNLAKKDARNDATSWAAPILDKYYDQTQNVYKDSDGVWHYSSPYGEKAFYNTIYGQGMKHQVGLRNLIESKSSNLSDLKDKAYTMRSAAINSGDYDLYDQIGADFDAEVVKVITPYIKEYGAENVLNNSSVLDYLEEWFFVPSSYMKTKKGNYVPSLANNASKQRAFVRSYIKDLYGVSTSYDGSERSSLLNPEVNR